MAGYNVAHNSIGTVSNAPLASDLGKELTPPHIDNASNTWGTG